MATSRARSPSPGNCVKRSKRKEFQLRRLSIVFAFLFSCAGALAQSYPNGPITLVVSLAPGDAADISARTMAEDISRRLNVPVLVVNRPGAGGAVAAGIVAGAKKDGQTILFSPNS